MKDSYSAVAGFAPPRLFEKILYTHGRAYRSRYKTLIIVQAVSVSYLLFGFLTYMQQFPFWLFGISQGHGVGVPNLLGVATPTPKDPPF